MDSEDRIKKAYAAILNHDFELAVTWFEEAIAMEPDNAAYHYKLSITYSRSGRLNKSLEHANKAYKLDQAHEEYLFHLQNLRAKQFIVQAEKVMQTDADQLYQAVWMLKEAITLDPINLQGYIYLAETYSMLHQYVDAIQTIKEVLRLHPLHELASRLLIEYKEKLSLDLHNS